VNQSLSGFPPGKQIHQTQVDFARIKDGGGRSQGDQGSKPFMDA
jgi:hypothetical protein